MNFPIWCRLFGHSLPPVFVMEFWGGLTCYVRLCRRDGCKYVHRVGVVEFERRYEGR